MTFNSKTFQERHLLVFNTAARSLVSLTQNCYSIGRSSTNDIVIVGDPISRTHARLCKVFNKQDGINQYLIFDGISDNRPSKNGTFVNGDRHNHYPLKNRDLISFANIVWAAYFREELSDDDFEQFQETVVSDLFFNNIFCEDHGRIGPSYHPSNLDYTTIMLGESSARSKQTISLDC
jgi:pSer/pThr/pTyr-binding forkhead associated (FHA) protein